MQTLQKISLTTPLKPGDKIRLDIKPRWSMGETVDAWLSAMRIYNIEQNHPEFTIDGYDYNEAGLSLRVTVTDAVKYYAAGVLTPAAVIAIAIGVSVVFLSVTVYKVSDVIAEVVSTPAGQVAAAGSGLFLAAMGAVAIWFIFMKGKK